MTTEVLRDTTHTTSDNQPLEMVAAYSYADTLDAVSGICKWFCQAQYVETVPVSEAFPNGIAVHYKNYTSISSITGLTLANFLSVKDGVKPTRHP